MEPAVFGLALQRLGIAHNGRGNRSYEAARLVMVEGKRMAEATRICHVKRQTVYETMNKIEQAFEDLGICYTCGQRLPDPLSGVARAAVHDQPVGDKP